MIDREHVQRIAQLARLALSEDEIQRFTQQLGSILSYADQLSAVPTNGVEPTAFVSPGHDPLRNDQRSASLPRELLLRGGPCVKKDHFAVPKVINQ
jgi:aspartyl-tRNA(Asn)/glutamyl-tRNA(Gln) amidotransferase subunit C